MNHEKIIKYRKLDRKPISCSIYAKDMPWLSRQAYINGTTISGFIRSLVIRAREADERRRLCAPDVLSDREKDALLADFKPPVIKDPVDQSGAR